MARFLLFVAFHNKAFAENELKDSKHKFLRVEEWESEDYKTLEHIVPQDHEIIHTIGNLILLPRTINSKVGKKIFKEKIRIYKDCLNEEHSKNVPWVRILDEVVSYNPETSTDENGHMNVETIKQRGERLGNAIWDTLARDWLGWE